MSDTIREKIKNKRDIDIYEILDILNIHIAYEYSELMLEAGYRFDMNKRVYTTRL